MTTFASGGVMHLVLEALAYALDEAVEGTTRSYATASPAAVRVPRKDGDFAAIQWSTHRARGEGGIRTAPAG